MKTFSCAAAVLMCCLFASFVGTAAAAAEPQELARDTQRLSNLRHSLLTAEDNKKGDIQPTKVRDDMCNKLCYSHDECSGSCSVCGYIGQSAFACVKPGGNHEKCGVKCTSNFDCVTQFGNSSCSVCKYSGSTRFVCVYPVPTSDSVEKEKDQQHFNTVKAL